MEGGPLARRLTPAALHEGGVARSQLGKVVVALTFPLGRSGQRWSQTADASKLMEQRVIVQALVGLPASPDLPKHNAKRENVHLHQCKAHSVQSMCISLATVQQWCSRAHACHNISGVLSAVQWKHQGIGDRMPSNGSNSAERFHRGPDANFIHW